MKNEDQILENILKTKTQIEAPISLEEKIMRRVFSERSKTGNQNILFFFFRKNSLAFAALAALLIAVSVFMRSPNVNNNINTADNVEIELQQSTEELDYYDTAENIYSEIDSEDDIEDQIKDIEELDSYIEMLNS